MEQKHLIIVDEQSQSATLDAIKNTLKNGNHSIFRLDISC